MYSFNTLSELKRNVLQLEKLHTRNVWFYDNQPSHTIYSPRLIEEECWLLEQFPHYEEASFVQLAIILDHLSEVIARNLSLKLICVPENHSFSV